ncbi:MAG: hypothetical protein HGA85_01375 [Nanoarchaeota archaeon]|nr:hypothetical protein [Nanoarchaeota archaeon]
MHIDEALLDHVKEDIFLYYAFIWSPESSHPLERKISGGANTSLTYPQFMNHCQDQQENLETLRTKPSLEGAERYDPQSSLVYFRFMNILESMYANMAYAGFIGEESPDAFRLIIKEPGTTFYNAAKEHMVLYMYGQGIRTALVSKEIDPGRDYSDPIELLGWLSNPVIDSFTRHAIDTRIEPGETDNQFKNSFIQGLAKGYDIKTYILGKTEDEPITDFFPAK